MGIETTGPWNGPDLVGQLEIKATVGKPAMSHLVHQMKSIARSTLAIIVSQPIVKKKTEDVLN